MTNEVTNRDLKREDIIRIAREGGLEIKGRLYEDVVIAVAMRVAAVEREACAKVCDARTLKNERACDGADADETISLRSAAWQISVCAAAIRARGEA